MISQGVDLRLVESGGCATFLFIWILNDVKTIVKSPFIIVFTLIYMPKNGNLHNKKPFANE